MTSSNVIQSGYLPVNGLEMYYESHGPVAHGQGGAPLVLLHGAFSAIGTSFGLVLPGLAEGRRVIAFDLQAHGRTADTDRPMTLAAVWPTTWPRRWTCRRTAGSWMWAADRVSTPWRSCGAIRRSPRCSSTCRG